VTKSSSTAPPADAHVHHHTHSDIVKRLRRAEGHIRSIVTMIEAGRPCLDVAQQLHAVEKAVSQAKRTFIHDHLDDCLEHSIGALVGSERGAIEEFKEITKYL
jgi:DNA-binding FrmR family transcriptional regulator